MRLVPRSSPLTACCDAAAVVMGESPDRVREEASRARSGVAWPSEIKSAAHRGRRSHRRLAGRLRPLPGSAASSARSRRLSSRRSMTSRTGRSSASRAALRPRTFASRSVSIAACVGRGLRVARLLALDDLEQEHDALVEPCIFGQTAARSRRRADPRCRSSRRSRSERRRPRPMPGCRRAARRRRSTAASGRAPPGLAQRHDDLFHRRVARGSFHHGGVSSRSPGAPRTACNRPRHRCCHLSDQQATAGCFRRVGGRKLRPTPSTES